MARIGSMTVRDDDIAFTYRRTSAQQRPSSGREEAGKADGREGFALQKGNLFRAYREPWKGS